MFYALSDATRRAMLERLVNGPASVTELARPFDMALPSLVQHLGVLEDAGIVTSCHIHGGIDAWKKAQGPLVR